MLPTLNTIHKKNLIINNKIKGIYIHLPFCLKKCTFCDFSIYAIGNNNNNLNSFTQNGHFDKYVNSLLHEISFFSKENQRTKLKSIYFGGGTPTLLPISYIENIIKHINKYFDTDIDTEISIESDPGTFDKEKLEKYEEFGINRITIGIQTLNQNIHNTLNRSHSVKDIYNSLDLIQKSKILCQNFGVDYIIGLPNQSNTDSYNDLLFLSNISNHISVYPLSLEKKSSLYKSFNNIYNTPEYKENLALSFISIHDLLLSKGYDHYEISNYAIYPYKSRHNKLYWDFDDYLGFGLSSSSKIGRYITKNPSLFKEYYSYCNTLYHIENNYEELSREYKEYIKINKDYNYHNNYNNTLYKEEVEVLNTIEQYFKYQIMNEIRINVISPSFDKIRKQLKKVFNIVVHDDVDKLVNKSEMIYGDFILDIRKNKSIPEIMLVSDEILINLLLKLNI